MTRKHWLVLILLFIILPVSAQQMSLNGIKTQLNIMFSNLDKTKVPTGFLWDTAVNLIDGDDFNGSSLTDSNYVSMSVMGDMLKSINSASVGADTICVEAALSRIRRNSSPHNVTLGILFQPYNYIVANALTDNLINYSNGIVSDSYKNGIWQNPYESSVLFGYMVGEENGINTSVTYSFTSIDSLSTQTFQYLEFDPGDGGGFRSVTIGGSLVVNYLNEGYFETILRATVGGLIYQSHGMICVKGNHPIQNGLHHHHFRFSFEERTAVFQGQTYCARINYKDTVSFSKQPLIISEGFDPWRLYQPEIGETLVHDYSGFTDIYDVLDESFSSSFDVFYVDWYDCGADIKANAEVLKEVIRWVNSHNASGKPNVVLGQSMGGLIARYALRDMELNNESHNTTLFISHDVPYLGANVSPGFLYLYRDLYDLTDNIIGLGIYLFSDWRNEFDELRRFGSFKSVKQMLPNYLDDTWNYDNSEFLAFQTELSQMGFPRGDSMYPIENVAIINGGKPTSGSTSFYNNGDKLFSLNARISTCTLSEVFLSALSAFLIQRGTPFIFLPGKSTIKATYDIYPYLSNNSLVAKSYVKYTKKFLWMADVGFTVNDKNHPSPSSGVPFDSGLGSCYDISDFGLSPEIDTSHTTLAYSYDVHIDITDSLVFIPTASAMAMQSPNDFFRDFYANQPSAGVETPFTSYILQNNCSKHIDFFPGTANWLETVVQTEISCPSVVLGGESASLSGNPNNNSFTWSSSSQLAINSSTGQISVVEDGMAQIKATYSQNGAVVTKTKYVLAGFPEETLSAIRFSDGSYKVWATPLGHGVRDMMKQAVADSLMSYIWGVKEGTSDIVWQSPSTSDTLSLASNHNNTERIVLLKIKGWNGSESNPVFISVNSPVWFDMNLLSVSKPRHSDIVYELFPTWPELVSDYGHDCLVLHNPFYNVFPYEPTSITLDSYTYPLTEKRTMLDGTVVFVFDVLNDQTFHDVFYNATLPYNSPSLKSLYMNTTVGVSVEYLVLCCPEVLPNPI